MADDHRAAVTEAAARALFEARHSGYAVGMWPVIAEEVKSFWRSEAQPIVRAAMGELERFDG